MSVSPAAAVQVVDAEEMARALRRIAHEIVERDGGASPVLAGIPTRGVPLAWRLARCLDDLGRPADVIELPVEGHRDDRDGARSAPASLAPEAVTDRVVILVDDVIFHGRTARAALDALTSVGRPAAVRLAVMVDRGHRELPIRADFVGKNIPTHINDRVRVLVEEVDGADGVVLVKSDG